MVLKDTDQFDHRAAVYCTLVVVGDIDGSN